MLKSGLMHSDCFLTQLASLEVWLQLVFIGKHLLHITCNRL